MEGEKLSIAYRELETIHPRIVNQFAKITKHLDLTENKLTDITPLKDFIKLESLILDNNLITHNVKLPKIPTLTTLWVNNNKISNLIQFVDQLAITSPNIKYLSMLGNEACPNYMNGSTLKQYNDYRYYVLSRLKYITHIDSAPITQEERLEAQKIYGNLILPSTLISPESSLAKKEVRKKKKSDGL